jgi:hypothetical protein
MRTYTMHSKITEVMCILPKVSTTQSNSNSHRGSSSLAVLNERSIVGIAITCTPVIGHLLLVRLVNGSVEGVNLTAITFQAEANAKVY